MHLIKLLTHSLLFGSSGVAAIDVIKRFQFIPEKETDKQTLIGGATVGLILSTLGQTSEIFRDPSQKPTSARTIVAIESISYFMSLVTYGSLILWNRNRDKNRDFYKEIGILIQQLETKCDQEIKLFGKIFEIGLSDDVTTGDKFENIATALGRIKDSLINEMGLAEDKIEELKGKSEKTDLDKEIRTELEEVEAKIRETKESLDKLKEITELTEQLGELINTVSKNEVSFSIDLKQNEQILISENKLLDKLPGDQDEVEEIIRARRRIYEEILERVLELAQEIEPNFPSLSLTGDRENSFGGNFDSSSYTGRDSTWGSY